MLFRFETPAGNPFYPGGDRTWLSWDSSQICVTHSPVVTRKLYCPQRSGANQQKMGVCVQGGLRRPWAAQPSEGPATAWP